MFEKLANAFSQWGGRKLRFSQIKMLYQNSEAVDYLYDQFKAAYDAGLAKNSDIVDSLAAFRQSLDGHIITLTYSDLLVEFESNQLLGMNAALRNVYGGYIEGKRRAIEQFGGSSGDLGAFEKRFVPVRGWKRFTDVEWDRLVSNAISNLKE